MIICTKLHWIFSVTRYMNIGKIHRVHASYLPWTYLGGPKDMGLQVHWISIIESMHGFFWILNLWQSQWVGNKWVWILIFSYYIGQFNLAAATQTLSSPYSLLQDTPLMRYLYQRSQSGILGTTTKRSVWDTTTASNQLAVPIFRKKIWQSHCPLSYIH